MHILPTWSAIRTAASTPAPRLACVRAIDDLRNKIASGMHAGGMEEWLRTTNTENLPTVEALTLVVVRDRDNVDKELLKMHWAAKSFQKQ